MDASKFVRVSEHFRIIALGLPVPRFPGNPLDPPLRSRFQARDVHSAHYGSVVERLSAAAPRLSKENPALLERIASFQATLRELGSDLAQNESYMGTTHLPEVSTASIESVVATMDAVPSASFPELFHNVCPYRLLLPAAGIRTMESTLEKFDLLDGHTAGAGLGSVPRISPGPPTTDGAPSALVQFESDAPVAVPAGPMAPEGSTPRLVKISAQQDLLHRMLVSHSRGDMCLVGPRGGGKSAIVSEFARLVGYTVQPVLLHKDMTARDLLQTRGTDASGDTVWRLTPLVTAALDGSLAVLDGVHRVDPSTLAVLQRLAQDREIVLHDGTHLMGRDRYLACRDMHGLSDPEMAARGFRMIHPSFRMIAVGEQHREGGKGCVIFVCDASIL